MIRATVYHDFDNFSPGSAVAKSAKLNGWLGCESYSAVSPPAGMLPATL